MSHLYCISFHIEDGEDFNERYAAMLIAIGERSVETWAETPYFAMADSDLPIEQLTAELTPLIRQGSEILLIVELEEAQYRIEGNYKDKPA